MVPEVQINDGLDGVAKDALMMCVYLAIEKAVGSDGTATDKILEMVERIELKKADDKYLMAKELVLNIWFRLDEANFHVLQTKTTFEEGMVTHPGNLLRALLKFDRDLILRYAALS